MRLRGGARRLLPPVAVGLVSLVMAGQAVAGGPVAAPASAPTAATSHAVCIESFADEATAGRAAGAIDRLARRGALGRPAVLTVGGSPALCLAGFASATEALASGVRVLESQPFRQVGVAALSVAVVQAPSGGGGDATTEAPAIDDGLVTALGGSAEGLPSLGTVSTARAFVQPLPDSSVPDAEAAAFVASPSDRLLLAARTDDCDGGDCLSWYLALYATPTGYAVGYVLASQVEPAGAPCPTDASVRAALQPLLRQAGREVDELCVWKDGSPRTISFDDLDAGTLPLVLSWEGRSPVVTDAAGKHLYP
jgi:hypothetical protein